MPAPDAALNGDALLACVPGGVYTDGPDLEIELFLLHPDPTEIVTADRARGGPS